MSRPPSSTPTERELEILSVIWQRGPTTVRQIFIDINKVRRTQYSSTLKIIQVMTDKGLLLRDDRKRPQVYRTAQRRERTQLGLVDYIIQKGFAGSAMDMVMSAVASKRISTDELSQVRRMIERAKSKRKK